MVWFTVSCCTKGNPFIYITIPLKEGSLWEVAFNTHSSPSERVWLSMVWFTVSCCTKGNPFIYTTIPLKEGDVSVMKRNAWNCHLKKYSVPCRKCLQTWTHMSENAQNIAFFTRFVGAESAGLSFETSATALRGTTGILDFFMSERPLFGTLPCRGRRLHHIPPSLPWAPKLGSPWWM